MAGLKFILSFLLVAVYLSPQVQSALLKNDNGAITRKDLVIGSIQPQDKLLYSRRVVLDAKPGQAVSEDVYFYGFAVQVNYISAKEDGTQGGNAVLIAGSLGQDTIGLRLTSAVGSGLKYMVTMYGN